MRLFASLCLLVGLTSATFDMATFGDQNQVNNVENVIEVSPPRTPQPSLNKSLETKPKKSQEDMWYAIAGKTDLSFEARAKEISEKYAQSQQTCAALTAMLLVNRFDDHEDEFKKRFGEKWKPSLREFVKRKMSNEEKRMKDKKKELCAKEDAKEKKRIIAELEREMKSPFGMKTTVMDSTSELSDALLDIAQDTEKDFLERTLAITNKYVDQQKPGGYLMGLVLSIRFESHIEEFKELFGDNWKPALLEYFRRVKNGELYLQEEVDIVEKEKVIAEVARIWPLRKVFSSGKAYKYIYHVLSLSSSDGPSVHDLPSSSLSSPSLTTSPILRPLSFLCQMRLLFSIFLLVGLSEAFGMFGDSISDMSEDMSDPKSVTDEMRDKWFDIALETDRPMLERAMAISEEMVKKMKMAGMLVGMTTAMRFDRHADEFKERFGGNWKEALKEFVRRETANLETKNEDGTEKDREAENKKIIAQLEKEFKKTPLVEVPSAAEDSHGKMDLGASPFGLLSALLMNQ